MDNKTQDGQGLRVPSTERRYYRYTGIGEGGTRFGKQEGANHCIYESKRRVRQNDDYRQSRSWPR